MPEAPQNELVPAQRSPSKMRHLLARLTRRETPKWFLASAALLVLGGAWLFLDTLEDVVTGDPLVQIDVLVHDTVRTLRSGGADSFFVAVTELGDLQVLGPVIVAVLGWLLVGRYWLAAAYWLAAVGVAEALVKVIKLALHRPRPEALYAGLEQFSFPSGHATLSVVVYGFLAFMLAGQASSRLRLVIASAATLLIGGIALSRLYLGVHWMSDVVGGLSFGAAWVAALAIAYVYQRRELFRTGSLAVVALATLAAAAAIHIGTSHGADLLRHAAVNSPPTLRR
jgi:cation-transporting ATPase E